jgi:hypothetical protein
MAIFLFLLQVLAEGRAACAVSLKCEAGGARPPAGEARDPAAAGDIGRRSADGAFMPSRARSLPTCLMWRVRARSACVAVRRAPPPPSPQHSSSAALRRAYVPQRKVCVFVVGDSQGSTRRGSKRSCCIRMSAELHPLATVCAHVLR